jgi:serine/threonine-protein kinase
VKASRRDLDWDQTWELFHEVIEAPGAERADRLERVVRARGCGESVRRRLEELVECFGRAGDLLDRPERLRLSLLEPGGEGDRYGPWQVVDRLGEGGVGTVYRVERTEGGFRQQAALKLLRSSRPGSLQLERFERERQILASIDHPNIARLLDGGSTEDGQPYLVLELVEGLPIDRFCTERGLRLEARCELFVKVARAVDAAHRQLVVHRDLKPANILVDGRGEPRLLDFGLARLLDEDPTATQTAARMLTPRYASPEQILGQPVTTATDVYSLGVVLYELIAGRSPYGEIAAREQPHLLARAILEEEPPRLHRVATRDRREVAGSRQLRVELDAIARAALAKSREQRYASPGHLADDLERALRGEPVQARPWTLSYGARRFVARHRLGVALAALAVAAVVGTTALLTVQSFRLRQALTRAEQSRDEAAEVGTFLTELFEVAGEGTRRPEDISAKEVLDRGAARIAERLADRPQVRARLHRTVGSVYRGLGLYAEAGAQLEAGLELLGDVFGGAGSAPEERVALLAELARVREVEGRLDETTALYRQAIEVARANPATPLLELARLWAELSEHQAKFNGIEEAEEAEQARVAARGALERASARSPEEQLVLADVYESLARVEHGRGRFEEERALLEDVTELRTAILGERHPTVAESLTRLGDVAMQAFEDERAESLYRQAIASFEASVGPNHQGLAAARNSLGHLLSDQGRYDDAAVLFRQVLESLEALGESARDSVEWSSAVQGMAVGLLRTGRPEEAERLFREVVSVRERRYGRDHTWTRVSYHYLAQSLEAQGRTEEAASLPRAGH